MLRCGRCDHSVGERCSHRLPCAGGRRVLLTPGVHLHLRCHGKQYEIWLFTTHCYRGDLVFWVAETFMAITLAFSRCVELCSESWGKRLFLGWRTWLWMIPPSVYAFYFGWFTNPVAFSGMYFSWFFNPHVGYLDDRDNKVLALVV